MLNTFNNKMLNTFYNWIETNRCPICNCKSNVNDIYDQKSEHYKCIYKIINSELRILLNNPNANLNNILNTLIPENKFLYFAFRDGWQEMALSWTLPPTYSQLDLLSRITGFNDYLEIGAGTGLLASIMIKSGFDFIAVTDIIPGKFKNNIYKPYCEMEALDYILALEKYGDKANVLLISWSANIEYNEKLELFFKGNYIVHIGENEGCTDFNNINEKKWSLIDTIKIPHWKGLRDKLSIYSRNTILY